MIFKKWPDTRPKMETHEPNVYPTILGGVSRGFWTPFLYPGARSAIFWHLKTGTFGICAFWNTLLFMLHFDPFLASNLLMKKHKKHFWLYWVLNLGVGCVESNLSLKSVLTSIIKTMFPDKRMLRRRMMELPPGPGATEWTLNLWESLAVPAERGSRGAFATLQIQCASTKYKIQNTYLKFKIQI